MDGFLLTGSLSNVHPDQYNQEIINDDMLLDESRDRSVFKMFQSIIQKEMPVAMSNVAVYNPNSNKGDRIGFKWLEDGRKVRFFKSDGEVIDQD